jgi:hypothetical protein
MIVIITLNGKFYMRFEDLDIKEYNYIANIHSKKEGYVVKAYNNDTWEEIE